MNLYILDVDFDAGEEIQCYVTNINLQKRLFYGITDEEIIKGVIRRKKKKLNNVKVSVRFNILSSLYCVYINPT